jgi:hypothetical protein
MPDLKNSSKGWKVVTNCSSIKRRQNAPITPALSHRTLEDLCEAWINKVNKASDLAKASETYGGRSFSESLAASSQLSADLYVISAGLGLVHAEDLIPHYNLTISQGDGSIAAWLRKKSTDASDWWRLLNQKLNKPGPLFRLAKSSDGLLLALPSTYLNLVSDELMMMSDETLAKVYIITSHAGQRNIAPKLRGRCLPYDERLDGSPLYQGTRNDFPQRALKHLVSEIDFKDIPISTTQSKVLDYLKSHTKPTLPARVKQDDQQIKQLIRKNWEKCEGNREKLLRYLRDIALVSCEQKRFGYLWNEVKLDFS